MERFDFSSVIQIINKHISESHNLNQVDLIISLFSTFSLDDKSADFDFNAGNINRWIKGISRVSPEIIAFYAKNEKNRIQLSCDLKEYIVPKLFDVDVTVQEIQELVNLDIGLSEAVKQKVCELLPDSANFICTAIISAMERPFVKKGVSLPTTSGTFSPVVADYILDGVVPKPCKHFCGRDNEINQLHELLTNNHKIFIHGIPGIGKSEFVKGYAAKHKKDYTQILYFIYNGSLKNMIVDIDFVDDSMYSTESQTDRFRRHNRFFKALKEDTLIIIDNFNATAFEEVLDVIMKYKCRIIFTTRNRFDSYKTCQHIEIQNIDTLISLAGKFYTAPNSEKETVIQIIETIHRHTMSVEMSARILEKGIHTPDTVLSKLIEGHAVLDSADKINIHKDGKNTKATYDWHIQTLFSLCDLSEQQQSIMRNMTFISLDGIKPRLFAQWLGLSDLNDVNDLIDLGFIQESENRIKLHPVFKELVISKLKPSVTNCETLLDSIQKICLAQGEDFPHYKVMFQTVENIIKFINNDDIEKYLFFLGNVFPYMQIKGYTTGMNVIITEMSALLKNPNVGDNNNRALLYHIQGTYEKMANGNVKQAISFNEKALKLYDNTELGLNICLSIGTLYRGLKQHKQAEQFLETAMNYVDTMLSKGRATHDSIDVVQQYATLLFETGKPHVAVDLLKKWSGITVEYTDSCADYADINFEIFVMLLKLNNDDSRKYYDESFRVYKEIYHDNPEMLHEKYNYVLEIYNFLKKTVPEYITLP